MLSGISSQELKDQLSRINASSHFAGAKQLQLFLDLLASRTEPNNGIPLTQQEIGKAFGFRQFDPTKPTVRIMAGRLRSRLVEFYATAGRDDPIIVDFPKGPPYQLNAWKKKSRGLSPLDKAFQFYCEGRILWAQRTPESLQKSIACFEKAIVINPDLADPYAALAQSYFFMAVSGAAAPRKVMHQAKMYAVRAVNIDPANAEAHAALGSILSTFEWNWKRAGREFEKALQLDPDAIPVYALRANYLLSIGKTDEAIKDAYRILQMMAGSPSPLSASHAAKVLYAAGKYQESEVLLRHIRDLSPDFYLVHWLLGLLYGTNGDLLRARRSIERAVALYPEGPTVIASFGWINALAGDTDIALKILERLLAIREYQFVSGTDLALIYAALGRLDEAFEWMNRACRERSVFLTWLSVWPPFSPLFRDSRSTKILKQMGLTAFFQVKIHQRYILDKDKIITLNKSLEVDFFTRENIFDKRS